MPIFVMPFMKSRQIGEEEEEPFFSSPPFPLSLSIPCSTFQPSSFGPTKYLLHHSVLVVSVILSRQFLSWLSRKNRVFIILWRKVTMFFTTRSLRGLSSPPRITKKICWSNLPPDLCEEIGKRIQSRLDIVRFRSVCKKWRSCLPSPTRFPLQVPPLPNCYSIFSNVPCMINQADCYHVKSASAYVALQKLNQDNKFLAFWSKPKKKPLKHPPLSEHSFVSQAYHIGICFPFFRGYSINCALKMVMINATNGVSPCYARASDLSVVVHLNSGRLALLRLGFQARGWDTDFCSQVFKAIGLYRGTLCALDDLGRVFIMDLESLKMNQITPPSPFAAQLPQKQLFEAFGDLYLYTCCGNLTYKFSFQLQQWIRSSYDVKVRAVLAPLCLT